MPLSYTGPAMPESRAAGDAIGIRAFDGTIGAEVRGSTCRKRLPRSRSTRSRKRYLTATSSSSTATRCPWPTRWRSAAPLGGSKPLRRTRRSCRAPGDFSRLQSARRRLPGRRPQVARGQLQPARAGRLIDAVLVRIPEEGGQTRFMDLYRAYDTSGAPQGAHCRPHRPPRGLEQPQLHRDRCAQRRGGPSSGANPSRHRPQGVYCELQPHPLHQRPRRGRNQGAIGRVVDPPADDAPDYSHTWSMGDASSGTTPRRRTWSPRRRSTCTARSIA